MKKFDLYEIAIKVLGLYLVTILITQLKNIFIYLSIYLQQKEQPEKFGDVSQISIFLIVCIGFVLLALLTWFLLFKTREVTQLICKPTDKTENIKLFAERKTVYEICLVLLGLITIILTLPDFIFKLKNYISLVQNGFPIKPNDKSFVIVSGIKIAVGVLAIIYSVQISSILTKRKSTNECSDD